MALTTAAVMTQDSTSMMRARDDCGGTDRGFNLDDGYLVYDDGSGYDQGRVPMRRQQ